MPASRKTINEERLRVIYKRQSSPTWDLDYQAAIRATPQEAPSISRAFTLTPDKFDCREVHLLSTPERNFCLLGLYHPDVVGLQEQRILSPEPAEHPLWTMTAVDRTTLPRLKGVIDVAERLGYLDELPRVQVTNPGAPDCSRILVFPWTGDLLWALRESQDTIRCINWSVKDTYADFKRPGPGKSGQAKRAHASRATLARHEIEQVYYEDAGIPTIRVANEKLDSQVSANLRQLFLHHRRQLGLTDEQHEEIQRKYEIALEDEIPPSEVILGYVLRNRYSVDQCRGVLYQAIWTRQLRVDLFRPILINRPLHPETRDVLDVYAQWFGRA